MCSWRVPLQPWLSDPEDAPFLDPVLRKRAVKVKHVKRREKKSDKKVCTGLYWSILVYTGPNGGREGHWGLLGVLRRVTGSHWRGSGGALVGPGPALV